MSGEYGDLVWQPGSRQKTVVSRAAVDMVQQKSKAANKASLPFVSTAYCLLPSVPAEDHPIAVGCCHKEKHRERQPRVSSRCQECLPGQLWRCGRSGARSRCNNALVIGPDDA